MFHEGQIFRAKRRKPAGPRRIFVRMEREPISRSEQDLARVQAAVAASGDIAYDWDLRNDRIEWSGASHILERLVGKPDPARRRSS